MTILLTVLLILAIICILVIVFSTFMLYRNDIVYKERNRLIEELSVMAEQDIKRNKPWRWRYEAFEKYTYDKMIRQLTKFKWELHEILSWKGEKNGKRQCRK